MIDKIQRLELEFDRISSSRKDQLMALSKLINERLSISNECALNFICTHNSRRSQLAQLWFIVAAHYYGRKGLNAYSGGTEATAFNHRMVRALKDFGFDLKEIESGNNPRYSLESYTDEIFFSKRFDHESVSSKEFIAVMVCDHANENCPFVPGASARFSLQYEDPKAFDDSPQEKEAYNNKVIEIATEMLYLVQACE